MTVIVDPSDFDFNREPDSSVWAHLDLPFGISFIVSSPDVKGARDWWIDEGEIVFAGRIVSLNLRANIKVPPDSELGRAIDTAFGEFVRTERFQPGGKP